jgi:hypothetical protein
VKVCALYSVAVLVVIGLYLLPSLNRCVYYASVRVVSEVPIAHNTLTKFSPPASSAAPKAPQRRPRCNEAQPSNHSTQCTPKSTGQKPPVVTETQTGQTFPGSTDTKRGHEMKENAKVNTRSTDQKPPVVTDHRLVRIPQNQKTHREFMKWKKTSRLTLNLLIRNSQW